MTEEQIKQLAENHVRAQHARYGIASNANDFAMEVYREVARLTRAISILKSAGCEITAPAISSLGRR